MIHDESSHPDRIPSGGDEHATPWWDRHTRSGWEEYEAARAAFYAARARETVLYQLERTLRQASGKPGA